MDDRRRRAELPADPVIVSVSEDGVPFRSVARSIAHRAPGVLHLAVSLQVVDAHDGRWLLQRRALRKPLFAGRWSNTCCTHPGPDDDLTEAAIRRVWQEAGLVVSDLVPAGVFTYRAVDQASGLLEHERDHVFVAIVDSSTAQPDPQEIAELARLPYASALRLVQSETGTPWAGEVLRRSFDALSGKERSRPRSPRGRA